MDASTARARRLRRRPSASLFGRSGLILLVLLLVARPSLAADPLMTIAKNTLLGGATGLILGGTLTLVVDEQDRSEVVRWGAVIGTFGGFALGVVLAMHGEEDLFAEAAPTAGAPWSARYLTATRNADDSAGAPRPAPCPRPPRTPGPPSGQSGDWSLRLALLRFDW